MSQRTSRESMERSETGIGLERVNEAVASTDAAYGFGGGTFGGMQILGAMKTNKAAGAALKRA